MKIKSSIGFIGCGNMGSSIVKGILTKGVVLPRRVYVLDVDQAKASRLTRSLGVRKARSLKEIAQKSHVLVLAVKPQQLQDLARTLKPHLQKKHIIISILAGTTLKTLKKYCGSRPATVRVMPNLGALVGEAMSVICGQKSHALQVAKRIFGACGDVLVLRESYFDVVTAVSGSGPAYFFLLMELLEKEGVRYGLKRSEARRLVTQTAWGSVRLVKETLPSPEVLRKMVSSKGGTTEAAMKVFNKLGSEKIVQQALRRAMKRAKELSR